jgi:hypothetical protein
LAPPQHQAGRELGVRRGATARLVDVLIKQILEDGPRLLVAHVLAFARLFEVTEMLVCWASRPVLLIQSAGFMGCSLIS